MGNAPAYFLVFLLSDPQCDFHGIPCILKNQCLTLRLNLTCPALGDLL